MKETVALDPKGSQGRSLPLILDVEDFKGDFSFDALFGNLVNQHLPSFEDDETDASDGHGNINTADSFQNGNLRLPSDARGLSAPLFPETDALLSLFSDSCRELVDLQQQIDQRLSNLKKEVSVHDAKHRKTLAELEKGVDGLFESFARLDSRISSVGQTAAKIGDHLQSADAQRETASQTIDLIKYLMEFNSSPGDLMELSPLFSDDSRVAEAASIAQKLRSFAEEDIGRQGLNVTSAIGNATPSRGLEVAVANLQDYCNELENRLLSRFDAASQRRELSVMSECAKILSQFNRGTSAMQHYVATRPMFIDVEIMNADTRLVLGDQGSQVTPSNVSRGLSSLYKDITEKLRKSRVRKARRQARQFHLSSSDVAFALAPGVEYRMREIMQFYQPMPSVVTCLVSRRLGIRITDNDWELRDFIANLACKSFGLVYGNLQTRLTKTLVNAFLDPKKALTQHYGVIQGLTALGPNVDTASLQL